MQKPHLDNQTTFFLSIQNTYHTVDVALFKDNQLAESVVEDKMRASKSFLSLIDTVLLKHGLKFADLSFIAVNQGPGPFTTLRVVIASVNGLSFASKIPLIGVDALDALLLEHQHVAYPNTVALLNAFNHDVYFGIQHNDTAHVEKGYDNITKVLEKIKRTMPDKPIRFLGNGVELYAQEIKTLFGGHAHIPNPLPHMCTVGQIGLMGMAQWKKQEGLVHQLFPLYLKETTIHGVKGAV